MADNAKVKINGKWVNAEFYDPDEEDQRASKKNPPFIADPRVQETVLFLAGMGVGIYKGIKTIAGYLPNPSLGYKIKKALPWAGLSAMTFVVAPACGGAKNVVRVGAGAAAAKALFELFRKAPQPEKQEEVSA